MASSAGNRGVLATEGTSPSTPRLVAHQYVYWSRAGVAAERPLNDVLTGQTAPVKFGLVGYHELA
jgi:hypothetical protein